MRRSERHTSAAFRGCFPSPSALPPPLAFFFYHWWGKILFYFPPRFSFLSFVSLTLVIVFFPVNLPLSYVPTASSFVLDHVLPSSPIKQRVVLRSLTLRYPLFFLCSALVIWGRFHGSFFGSFFPLLSLSPIPASRAVSAARPCSTFCLFLFFCVSFFFPYLPLLPPIDFCLPLGVHPSKSPSFSSFPLVVREDHVVWFGNSADPSLVAPFFFFKVPGLLAPQEFPGAEVLVELVPSVMFFTPSPIFSPTFSFTQLSPSPLPLKTSLPTFPLVFSFFEHFTGGVPQPGCASLFHIPA